MDVTSIWEVLISVAQYRPDYDTYALRIGRQDRTITIGTYLDKLYVPRLHEHFEDYLFHEMQVTARILCVAGENGSGKTSALEFVKRRFQAEAPHLKVIKLNMKTLYDAYSTYFPTSDPNKPEPIESYVQAFRRLLRDIVRTSLFPSVSDYRHLISWLLAGPPQQPDDFDISLLSSLQDAYCEITALARCEELPRHSRCKAIYDYLAANPTEDCKFRRLVSKRVLIAHAVFAYLDLNRSFTRIVLILDNVDRLPLQQQAQFLLAIRDMQAAVQSKCCTTVALRTENISHLQPRDGHDYFFDLILPDGYQYPGLVVPGIDDHHLQHVLQKRDAYAEELLAACSTTPVLPSQLLRPQYVYDAHRLIVQQFLEERVHDLANSSCRVLLTVYVGFLRFIWGCVDKHKLDLVDLGKRYDISKHVKTLFYFWLQDFGPDVGIPLHNVVDWKYNPHSNSIQHVASAQHLLLTCMYNMVQNSRMKQLRNSHPRWDSVVAAMKTLQFDYNTIRDAASQFVAAPDRPAGAIKFLRRDVDPACLAEQDQDEITLTRLGEEIVRNVLHSSGYVIGASLRKQYGGTVPVTAYFELTPIQRAKHVMSFTVALAQKHLKAIALWHPAWAEKHGVNWVWEYRQQFGVNERLQCERIFEGAGRFFRELFRDESNPFLRACDVYTALVNDIARGIPYEQLDIVRLKAMTGRVR